MFFALLFDIDLRLVSARLCLTMMMHLFWIFDIGLVLLTTAFILVKVLRALEACMIFLVNPLYTEISPDAQL
jgi:hypothetical protein